MGAVGASAPSRILHEHEHKRETENEIIIEKIMLTPSLRGRPHQF